MLTISRYVLSPTHLYEFKSADRIETQSPVMSLYLPEQKLGSHSNSDSSSHKFMLKGRQTGGMHRGHGWVFRAESRETMLAWYEDIKNLTEKTGEERNAFVRKHARSFSAGSHKAGSISSEGALDEDEADHVPYSATTSQFEQEPPEEPTLLKRPQPGGRFPSDINVNRDLRIPLSPSSRASSDDHEALAANGPLLRSSSFSRQENRPVQHEEQTTEVKQRVDQTRTNRVDERDIITSSTYKPASANPSRLSSHQPQNNLPEGRWNSNIANAANGEIVGSSRDEPASGIPLRLSSFQAQYNGGNEYEQERPHKPLRTFSDDPETVAAAMGLPGSNFPYVQTDDPPQLKEDDSRQTDPAVGESKGIDYLHSGSYPEDSRNTPHVESPSRQSSNFAAYQDLVTAPTGQNIEKAVSPLAVSSKAAVSTEGSECFSQAAQTQGFSSDAPGAVTYAQDHQTQANQSSTPYKTLDTNAKTMERPGNKTQTKTTSADATGLEVNNDLPGEGGQATKPPQITSQSDFEIGAALQQHRDRRQQGLEMESQASKPDPQSETTSLELHPPISSAVQKDTDEAPVPTPVELGQFGSTPKQPETTTFETSFTSASIGSPIAPLSAAVGNSHGEDAQRRPPLPSHVTISDLHVPGEFPYSPQAETAF